jgi:hypothetical protein
VQIVTNGYVTLGSSLSAANGALSQSMTPCFAPFNVDLHPQLSNTICYSTHLAGDPYLQLISRRVSLVGGSSMSIRFALVVTYYHIGEYASSLYDDDDVQQQRITFQLVLFTDGIETRFFFNYDTQNSAWTARASNIAQMGYSFGRQFDPSGRYSEVRTLATTQNLAIMSNTGTLYNAM